MKSIIPNALMKWNSAFATLPPPPQHKQGVNALEPLTTLQVYPIQREAIKPKRSYQTTPLNMSTDKELTPLKSCQPGNKKCRSIRNVHPGPRPNQVHIYGIYIRQVQVLLTFQKRPSLRAKRRIAAYYVVASTDVECFT